jgi:hypothetical protein
MSIRTVGNAETPILYKLIVRLDWRTLPIATVKSSEQGYPQRLGWPVLRASQILAIEQYFTLPTLGSDGWLAASLHHLPSDLLALRVEHRGETRPRPMSIAFAFTALSMASSPGRLSLPLAPLMPASSKTRCTCQPDRAATASSSRRWLSVSCFDVDTLR